MRRAAKCIVMLSILSDGEIHQISDIKKEIERLSEDDEEENPRNIIEYRKELQAVGEQYGFSIEQYPGRNGGYKLVGTSILPAFKLTQAERAAFTKAYKHLRKDKTFLDQESFAAAYTKILKRVQDEFEHRDDELRDKEATLEYDDFAHMDVYRNNEQIKKWYEIIDKCIGDDAKKYIHDLEERMYRDKRDVIYVTPIELTYDFLEGGPKRVVVHPYELFMYDNEWRFYGWNMNAEKNPFFFKLSRIINIKVLEDKKAAMDIGYKGAKSYIRDGVFAQSGEMFDLTLIASGQRAKLFKEKEFGKNQKVKELANDRVKVTMTMQKNYTTYNFILGCGELVEVVEPAWLIDKIKELATTILKKYK